MIYSILVSAGLENIARQEIIARFGETEQFKILMRKPQRIVFQYSGNPKHLLSLRTAAQLFLVIKHIPNMTRSRRSLSSISGALSRFNFRKALDCCRTGRHQSAETRYVSGNEPDVRIPEFPKT